MQTTILLSLLSLANALPQFGLGLTDPTMGMAAGMGMGTGMGYGMGMGYGGYGMGPGAIGGNFADYYPGVGHIGYGTAPAMGMSMQMADGNGNKWDCSEIAKTDDGWLCRGFEKQK